MSHIVVYVSSNPDLDDCLTGAAEAYVAEHPELAGYDLSPQWGPVDGHETVTLTVPLRPIIAGVENVRERSAALWATAVDTAGPEYDGGSEERQQDMQALASSCLDAYDRVLEDLRDGNYTGAGQGLEVARSLEAEGGDCSTAYDAARILSAVGI